jgi:hypothetical protein
MRMAPVDTLSDDYFRRTVMRVDLLEYMRDEVGIPPMRIVSSQRSIDTPNRVIAAALAIGVLYLACLILIHRLAG